MFLTEEEIVMKQNRKRKVAVVGAGWSGLSAAVHLCNHVKVTVFEASKKAGGRARALATDKGRFAFLDNGQHILLGAYRAVRHLMDVVGVESDKVCLKQPLSWYMANGLQFQAARYLSAPWHIVWGILRAKKIRSADKWALLRQMYGLQKRNLLAADISVANWLREQHCSHRLWRDFWQPLVLGALNTPLEQASLNVLLAVLRDGVWADKAGSEYWLPKQDLSHLLAEPAVQYLRSRGAKLHFETRVEPLRCLSSGKVEVEGRHFDAVVLAVAPYHLAALLPEDSPSAIQTHLAEQSYHAITTVYLRYAETLRLPAVMTGISEGTAQWLFDRSQLSADAHEIAAVISVSDQIGSFPPEEWIKRVHQDVKQVCPYVGEPVAAKAVTEKRATVASRVNRSLPDCRWLHHRGIYPAGDYLHPRYPATLEAAVQSGQTAAELILNERSLGE